MAAALCFAARKICGRAFQRQPQPYFTAAADASVKEEYRRLLPKISHAGIARHRLCSSEARKLVNNKKNGAASSATNNSEWTPWWSVHHPKFARNAFLVTIGICIEGAAIFYVEARLYGGSLFSKKSGLETDQKKIDD
uniref:Uncharacterized protein n=1 Tax=Avena sativa TaxID=4498 RepID=A0ACD5YXW3_AVESA